MEEDTTSAATVGIRGQSTLQHVQPTEEQKLVMQRFRDEYAVLLKEVRTLPMSRGLSLAVTKLEESAMWLNKAITKND